MNYLEKFGLVKDEPVQERIRAKNLPDFHSDLSIQNYFYYLRWFSLDRKPRDGLIYNNGRGRYSDINGRGGIKFIEDELKQLFYPLQDKNKIAERQNIIRRFIVGEEERGLVKKMLGLQVDLYNALCIDDPDAVILDHKIAINFSKFVYSLNCFIERYSSDNTLGTFANEASALIQRPIAAKSRVMKNGLTLAISDKGFYLIDEMPRSPRVVDLGEFQRSKERQMEYYPGEGKDKYKLIEFVRKSSESMFLLGAFLYQAEVYRRMKTLGVPVCLPNINSEGLFKVRDSAPLTTELGEEPVSFSFEYTRTNRKNLFGGAHSGGKSELIRNIVGLHVVGLGGGILPCEEADIPMTRKILLSLKRKAREKEISRGSLEAEIAELLRMGRDLGPDDLLAVDEYLDTTKPELAQYVSDPLLGGLEGVCVGLANTPAAVFIVDHRASRMEKSFGFNFWHPVLEQRQVEGFEGLRLVPTHKFLADKPDPTEVSRHALQMWEDVKSRIADPQHRPPKMPYSFLGDPLHRYDLDEENRGTNSARLVLEESPDAWKNWEESPQLVLDEKTEPIQVIEKLRTLEGEKDNQEKSGSQQPDFSPGPVDDIPF